MLAQIGNAPGSGYLRAALFCLLLGCGASTAAGQQSDGTGQLPLRDLRTFTDVFEHIRRNYVEEIDDSTLFENAIRGMLTGLDPHSAFLDRSDFEDLQIHTRGEFGGLGLEVGMDDGFVRVIAPIDDTPAQRAGVESGDIIIKLDDLSVKDMTLDQAVRHMRGPKGSSITLTIMREGTAKPFEIVIVRDAIKVRSVKSDVLEPGYGYLRIAQFQANTGAEASSAIASMVESEDGLKGLIIDLRNNPGGILQASVEVADSLLHDGMIVYTEGRVNDARAEFRATPGDLADGTPVIVLINRGSASASEIVAGALQDHGRAVIMGTESFGKGSVQTVMPISEDQAIKLTTALYYTPSGRSIQATGIEPDIVVERARVEKIAGQAGVGEANLSGHLKNGNGQHDKAAQADSETSRDDLQMRDNQLNEALTLLKGLNILSARSG